MNIDELRKALTLAEQLRDLIPAHGHHGNCQWCRKEATLLAKDLENELRHAEQERLDESRRRNIVLMLRPQFA